MSFQVENYLRKNQNNDNIEIAFQTQDFDEEAFKTKDIKNENVLNEGITFEEHNYHDDTSYFHLHQSKVKDLEIQHWIKENNATNSAKSSSFDIF